MRRPAELRSIIRVGNAVSSDRREDVVAVEAPLTLSGQGDVWLTTMRTPGNDRELIVGWLYHEGLLTDPERDVSSLTVCGKPGEPDFGNGYALVPGATMELRLQARDPGLFPRVQLTGCGLCGHQGLEQLVRSTPPRQLAGARWPLQALVRLFDETGASQELFRQTGCTHAASLVNTRGEVLLTREDVGRHNAVDKLVGRLALDGRLPVTQDLALLVSGRASFEMVHKAVTAGFSAMFCVSAPTSLAVDLAERSEMLLAGFFRSGGFNVYSGYSRITGDCL